MKAAVRDPRPLCRHLKLPMRYQAAAVQAAGQFAVFAPWEYIARMKPGDPQDPLLRQVLPLQEELDSVPGFEPDPLREQASTRHPGLLQKYQGRALLITSGACAVHCRYCFRRHFPYAASPWATTQGQTALDALARDHEIDELILSGGDPLTITDERLEQLVARVGQIDHLRRLRIHTRLPVVIPQRVTPQLVNLLRASRLTAIVVIHVNHPSELDQPTGLAIARLVDAGIPVLNQAVLLRGVNDDVETLTQLCRQLVDQRVMPYYLHQLDRVAGAAHFEVPIHIGQEIVKQLRSRLPGYAVPRYVREVPGHSGKTVLA
jgi:EF-P beta-lysylation protein EpmB